MSNISALGSHAISSSGFGVGRKIALYASPTIAADQNQFVHPIGIDWLKHTLADYNPRNEPNCFPYRLKSDKCKRVVARCRLDCNLSGDPEKHPSTYTL